MNRQREEGGRKRGREISEPVAMLTGEAALVAPLPKVKMELLLVVPGGSQDMRPALEEKILASGIVTDVKCGAGDGGRPVVLSRGVIQVCADEGTVGVEGGGKEEGGKEEGGRDEGGRGEGGGKEEGGRDEGGRGEGGGKEEGGRDEGGRGEGGGKEEGGWDEGGRGEGGGKEEGGRDEGGRGEGGGLTGGGVEGRAGGGTGGVVCF